jgi:hypothetical protein
MLIQKITEVFKGKDILTKGYRVVQSTGVHTLKNYEVVCIVMTLTFIAIFCYPLAGDNFRWYNIS